MASTPPYKPDGKETQVHISVTAVAAIKLSIDPQSDALSPASSPPINESATAPPPPPGAPSDWPNHRESSQSLVDQDKQQPPEPFRLPSPTLDSHSDPKETNPDQGQDLAERFQAAFTDEMDIDNPEEHNEHLARGARVGGESSQAPTTAQESEGVQGGKKRKRSLESTKNTHPTKRVYHQSFYSSENMEIEYSEVDDSYGYFTSGYAADCSSDSDDDDDDEDRNDNHCPNINTGTTDTRPSSTSQKDEHTQPPMTNNLPSSTPSSPPPPYTFTGTTNPNQTKNNHADSKPNMTTPSSPPPPYTFTGTTNNNQTKTNHTDFKPTNKTTTTPSQPRTHHCNPFLEDSSSESSNDSDQEDPKDNDNDNDNDQDKNPSSLQTNKPSHTSINTHFSSESTITVRRTRIKACASRSNPIRFATSFQREYARAHQRSDVCCGDEEA